MTETLHDRLAASKQAEPPEPVAWMYKSPFGREICKFRWGTDEGLTSDHWVGWTETALYPATAMADVDLIPTGEHAKLILENAALKVRLASAREVIKKIDALEPDARLLSGLERARNIASAWLEENP